MSTENTINGYYEVNSNTINSKKDSKFKGYFVGIVISSLLSIFAIIVLIPEVLVTVHAGEKGVLYKRLFGKEGVQLDKVYPEGLYFVAPWNKMTPYNIRVQQVIDPITVLSSQGMKMDIVLSIRYHPEVEEIPFLHQHLGPDYADTVLIPEVEGIVLSLFAKEDLTNIYTDIYKLIEKANVLVEADLKEKHIIVDELIVKSINFPESVLDAINEKIKQKQRALGYTYRLESELQEAKRKTIEAKGIQSFQSIISQGISENYLKWKGIDATLSLAKSNNSKVVVIGSAKNGLPIILNSDSNTPVKDNMNEVSNLPNKKGL